MNSEADIALSELVRQLEQVVVVSALWVGGSLATGDYVPGVSDLDLVATTSGRLEGDDLDQIVRIHEDLDAGIAAGMDLGCQYAQAALLDDVDDVHPTWTHGSLVHRSVSLVTRAELVLKGWSAMGPPPQQLLPAVTPDDVRAAAKAELAGYWSRAARQPLMFVRLPVMVDLGLAAMARARHALATGELMTKSEAIEMSHAPAWLKDQLRGRRRGDRVSSPRWRAAHVAWRDVRRTTSANRSSAR